jgi:hypothetical protein
MANVKRTSVDISAVIGGLDKLAAVQESIARSMGAAMGIEVRDEAKVRVPVGTDEGGSITPGLLQSAIYVAYDDQRRLLNPGAYRYTVSWNSKKAPHGHLIEFGHWMPYQYARTASGDYYTPKPLISLEGNGFWVNARPFLGPAFDAKLPRLAAVAYEAGRIKFAEVMK